ncbi:hypothetical protein BVRB_7g163550 [Beta vulgaris subsp. vulgaris]|nr:hypothetical protein BVRB_7g163550 [Beta vulgaris subsp. vulgaris]
MNSLHQRKKNPTSHAHSHSDVVLDTSELFHHLLFIPMISVFSLLLFHRFHLHFALLPRAILRSLFQQLQRNRRSRVRRLAQPRIDLERY